MSCVCPDAAASLRHLSRWPSRTMCLNSERLQEDPALLLNRGNDYLHYEDDWYIVGSKPDVYQFIYYKGNNDAWKG